MKSILSEIKFVVENAQDVSINFDAVKKLASEFSSNEKVNWTSILPFSPQKLSVQEKISFNVLFNAINFSYWGSPKWTIKYQNKELDGSWAMIGTIHRAIEEGYTLLDTSYQKNISQKDFDHIFRGNVPVPLAKERLQIIRDLGRLVESNFESDTQNIIKKADYDAEKLVGILTASFPFFDDKAMYKDKIVHFHKRAQLLVGDLHEVLVEANLQPIKNIEMLTAFADYKIPQILRKLGVLVYSAELTTIVDNKVELTFGDSKEVEIRADMVWAVELLKQEINKTSPLITAMDLDHYLWIRSQEKSKDDKPYHLTRTIFY